MSVLLVVYIAGAAVVGIAAAAYQELERRESPDPEDRDATLRPGLDGLVAGVCWPALAVLLTIVATIAAVGWIGRALADRVLPNGEQEKRP